MFGAPKPTFGSPATTGFSFGANNNAAASPFGATNTGFQQTPAFGQQASTSLFGGGAAQQTSNVFGATAAPAFGAPAQPTTQAGFSGFQTQNTSIFGSAAPTQTSTIFGQSGTSAFGAAKPATGYGFNTSQPTTSIFGQPNTATAGQSSFFNQPNQSLFGANPAAPTGFGAPTGGVGNGTAVAKYQPLIGTDTQMKNNHTTNVSTNLHCITAMKEYEIRSLEELRMEDYLANRKMAQAGTSGGLFGAQAPATTGIFGQTAAQPTSAFGQPENKGMFGQPANNTLGGFGQPTTAFGATANQNQGLFNKPFGAPAATSAPAFGFSNPTTTNTSSSLFKGFGQPATTNMFGATTATPAPAFGQPATSAFGQNAFGQPAASEGNTLFGQPAQDNKPAFGVAPNAAPAFGGFGTNTNTLGGGLFQPKPTTGFGAPSAFGTATSTAPATGFGTSAFGANTFGAKPATSTFTGFGTQPGAAVGQGTATLGGGLGTAGTGMFGQNQAQKPGGLFGTGAGTLGGGTTGSMFNTGLGFGSGTTGTLGNTGFGQTNSFGGMNAFMGGVNQNQSLLGTTATVPIHQQILAMATSPYGDNPIFKDLKPVTSEDSLKVTNPATQKALLESNSSAQFKLSTSTKPGSGGVKVKPVGSVANKSSLFDGLEEYDCSVDSFSMKPNARRLIIKPRSDSISSPSHSRSSVGAAMVRPADPTNKENEELFDNRIPTQRPAEANNDSVSGTAPGSGGRVSWLNSKQLEKARHAMVTNRNASDPLLSTTIQELMPEREKTPNAGPIAGPSNLDHSLNNSRTLDTSPRSPPTFSSMDSVNSRIFNETATTASPEQIVMEPYIDHPTGITLNRVGYYTIPSLDELCSYLSEDGTCIVDNFTVGREGYGNIYYNEQMDVANLNLDEIVFFRNKEVIVYPTDTNKPPMGQELNRKAQITLDQVWPTDKATHELIKDPARLAEMGYEGKLRRACYKYETRFVEYRPETGSWVFRVNHFSKYGLSDSDEDEEEAKVEPAKKAKMGGVVGKAGASGVGLGKAKGGTIAKTSTQHEKLGKSVGEDTSNLDMEDDQFDADFIPYMREVQSPTSAVASGFGIDAHKLQLMKASFFVDTAGDEFEQRSTTSMDYNAVDQESNNDDQLVPNRHFSRFSSMQSLFKDSSVMSLKTMLSENTNKTQASNATTVREERPVVARPSVMTAQSTVTAPVPPLIIRPKIFEVRHSVVVLPEQKSIFGDVEKKHSCFADIGILLGRRFKPGFGGQNRLTIVTNLQDSDGLRANVNVCYLTRLFQGRLPNNLTRPLVANLKIKSRYKVEKFEQSIVEHFKIQLNFSTMHQIPDDGEEDEKACPQMVVSSAGTNLLLSHCEQAKKGSMMGSSYERYVSTVWSLCLALWGDDDELTEVSPTCHLTVMRRRELMSTWLEQVVATGNDTNDDAMKGRDDKDKSKYLQHLVDLLMAHKVEEACELAFNNDDINLSLLLSQVSGGPVVRQLIQHQLSAWQDVEADSYIDPLRLKVYMLIAGTPLLSSTHGVLNVFEDVNWITALAINMWYLCSPTLTITDALTSYEMGFQNEDNIVAAPEPPYANNVHLQSERPIYDVRYHLLKLYSMRSHRMETLLNPATHTMDPMDYRLSWFLLQTLKALGYNHCSSLGECQLTAAFASQLEAQGQWHWTIFVLQHLTVRERREASIKEVLYRYVRLHHEEQDYTKEYEAKEGFVINDLAVPIEWIYYAKAIRAGYFNKYHEQVKYYLKARKWNIAHEILMDKIAPDAIINEEIDYLRLLLDQFEDPKKILNWRNQAQIIVDYLLLTEKFELLKQATADEDIEAMWEDLKPELTELCSRINLFPCPTAKHRLCQSEIAQKLACIVGGIIQTNPHINACQLVRLSLEKLPLPQEYAQNELRILIDTFVVDDFRQPDMVVGYD